MVNKKEILKTLGKIKSMDNKPPTRISKEEAIKRIHEKSVCMQWIDCKNDKELAEKLYFLVLNICGTFGIFNFPLSETVHRYIIPNLCFHIGFKNIFSTDYIYGDSYAGKYTTPRSLKNIIILNPENSQFKYWSDVLKGSYDSYKMKWEFENGPHKNIFILGKPYRDLLKTMTESCMGRIESLNWE